MRTVDENWLLQIVSLAYGIHECLNEIDRVKDPILDAAITLSEMQIKIFELETSF